MYRNRCTRIMLGLGFALTAGIVSSTDTQALAVWDLETDFSTSTATSTGIGPDGAWRFEYKDADDADDLDATNLWASSAELPTYFGGDGVAPDSGWFVPGVPGGSAVDHPFIGQNQIRVDPGVDLGDIIAHPISGGSPTQGIIEVIWVAPTNTIVDVSGNIWGSRSGPTSSRNHVWDFLHNASSLDSGTWNNNSGKANKTAFGTTELSVLAGDQVLLRTYRGSAGVDEFGVDFTVTEIPEPASLALLSIGGMLALGRRRA